MDVRRAEHLAGLADALGAPVASDHVCFVRAGGLDSGHLLPVPRTRDALEVLVDNAVLLQELAHYQKRRLLEQLRGRLPGTTLTDLRFRAGVIKGNDDV